MTKVVAALRPGFAVPADAHFGHRGRTADAVVEFRFICSSMGCG